MTTADSAPARAAANPPFLDGGGRATELICARDWAGHPLGAPDNWSDGLRTALSLVLNSPESMILCWGPDLHFFFNEAYFPMLGPRLDWAMGERFDRVWADGLEQAMPIIEAAFAGDSRRYVDLPWKLDTDRGAAETWWTFSYSRILDRDGAITGLFIHTNETTEKVLSDATLAQTQTELQALNQSLEARVVARTAERNLLATIFEVTDSFVHVIDTDYRWLAINRAGADEFERAFGVRPGIGDNLLGLLASLPEQRAHVEALWSRALAGEEFSANVELGQPRRRAYQMKFNTLRDEAGRIVGAFQIVDDVSERVNAAAELEQTREALRQSQKMEAVGQLTGGLAHDFNNMLTAVTGGLELLQRRIAQGRVDEVDRYIDMARAGAERAAALTQRLLAFSRRQTLAPTPTDANRLIVGLHDIVDRTLGPGIELSLDVQPDLWPVMVDGPQLENALLNLCINARDAMPGGGRLSIATRNHRVAPADAVDHDLAAGDYVEISVTDNGTGMTPAVIERAFEPFFTTKPLGEGTGLGLSMIYGFTRQSGGHVRIKSRPGAGTRVSLDLPRHLGVAAEAAAPATTQRADDRAAYGETILIVEDEVAIRLLMTDILRDAGYRTLSAPDAAAALEVVETGERIDLIISDVGLPGGIDGRQFADAARARRPGIGVLFVTGYAASAAVGPGQLEPGMTIMTKPFHATDFVQRVQAMMAAAPD